MKKISLFIACILFMFCMDIYAQGWVSTTHESYFVTEVVTFDSVDTDTTINVNFLKATVNTDGWHENDPNTLWILPDTTNKAAQTVGATDSLVIKVWPLPPSAGKFYDAADAIYKATAGNDSTYLTPNTTTGLDFDLDTWYVYSWEFDEEAAGYRIKLTYTSETGGLKFRLVWSK